ncbi:hypothetical protein [Parvularcula dongshanensis]|uniref:Uncharacterized protein n=1 Tax=Parvularcula dongshanensis TaxID=1173995 RepID=A0A840I377_9PROT|nr:hypothetical protein [Parvularcula dongshanensis]MBB4658638.1 hypothetical protein [Parvularcula dongshanensis]
MQIEVRWSADALLGMPFQSRRRYEKRGEKITVFADGRPIGTVPICGATAIDVPADAKSVHTQFGRSRTRPMAVSSLSEGDVLIHVDHGLHPPKRERRRRILGLCTCMAVLFPLFLFVPGTAENPWFSYSIAFPMIAAVLAYTVLVPGAVADLVRGERGRADP